MGVAYWTKEETLEKYAQKGTQHAIENGYMADENGKMEKEPTYKTVNEDMIGNADLHYTYIGKGIAHTVNGVEKGIIYSASGIGNAIEGSVDRTENNIERTNEAWVAQLNKEKTATNIEKTNDASWPEPETKQRNERKKKLRG